MTAKQRLEIALELARQAFINLADWKDEMDPAERRRLQMAAATQYRAAADVLDDAGRIK